MRRTMATILFLLLGVALVACTSADDVTVPTPFELEVCITASSDAPASDATCLTTPIERP